MKPGAPTVLYGKVGPSKSRSVGRVGVPMKPTSVLKATHVSTAGFGKATSAGRVAPAVKQTLAINSSLVEGMASIMKSTPIVDAASAGGVASAEKSSSAVEVASSGTSSSDMTAASAGRVITAVTLTLSAVNGTEVNDVQSDASSVSSAAERVTPSGITETDGGFSQLVNNVRQQAADRAFARNRSSRSKRHARPRNWKRGNNEDSDEVVKAEAIATNLNVPNNGYIAKQQPVDKTFPMTSQKMKRKRSKSSHDMFFDSK